jgi:aromatic-amino-acid transaminase
MFSTLPIQPADSLLAVMAAFAADASTDKVDLGVGVYRDAKGITPVMHSVRQAEQKMLATQVSKTYVGQAGNRAFSEFVEALTLGEQHAVRVQKRIATLQAPGGSGALRLAAELLLKANPKVKLVASDPTWANHIPLLGSAGIAIERYPYYDVARGQLKLNEMLKSLNQQDEGTVVLLHGSCHNPTGADLSMTQWHQVLDVVQSRKLMPLFDIAYQGLGHGLDEDAAAIRLFAEHCPEMLIASSCSKNFGVYRERVGAVMAIGQDSSQSQIIMSHLQSMARRIYSMPPDHGAAVIATIAADSQLLKDWKTELDLMRARVRSLRHALSDALKVYAHSDRFEFIRDQNGMFSMLGLPADAVKTLASDHHIYMAPDSRINVAGLPESRVEQVAVAVAKVI